MTKALFVPLKRKYYEDFRDGLKVEEFRPYGPGWNERTCWVGRPVVISLGYGKRHRLRGVIAGFEVRHEPTTTEAWKACYGERHPGVPAACIRITGLQPWTEPPAEG